MVERLRLQRQATFWGNGSVKYAQVRLSDLEALLAVVEAAKDVRTQGDVVTEGAARTEVLIHRIFWNALCESVDALYAPDSAEARNG
ncbi:MAG TPA: hypothetical protein VNH41_08540 [Steroidobacteraceae bacterium]|nr:hypothetical protein [Steroidobacteraceae bacterium]